MIPTTTLEALSAALSAIARYDHKGTLYAETGKDVGGTRRGLLRRFAWDFAGGRCFWCGDLTLLDTDKGDPRGAELGHVIPGGPNRTGYTPGNLGIMCRACNSDCGDRDLSTRLHNAVAPEGIPLEWYDYRTLAVMYPATDHSAEWTRRRHNRPAWD